MATVLKLKFASGKIRRCDSRCHNAKGDKCTCVCGGINHGVGLRQAIINSQNSRALDPHLPVNLIMLSPKDQLDLFSESEPQFHGSPKGD